MEYTFEIYKKDGRTKAGERFLKEVTVDCGDSDAGVVKAQNEISEKFPAPSYRIEQHVTWVTRTNFMSGKEFKERYDTPHYCSPSSESYWSM